MTGIAWIDALLGNPVFAGVGGAAIVSGLMYQLRALPERVYHAIKKAVVVELEIDNSQGVYDDVLELLAKLDSAKRVRRLKLVQSYDKEEDRWLWTPTIGRGLHLLRDGRKWMLVNRSIDDQSKSELRPRERLEIMLLGRGQSEIRDLVLRSRVREAGKDTLQVYLWAGGCYNLADEKPRRALDTVFIPPAQRARLLSDMAAFMAGKSEYRRRGTPWRRGYLLEGPPGTGKSSLIFALACEFGLPIYIINLNTVNGDTGLQVAFSNVPPRGIAVIEDIDALEVTHQRQPRKPASSAPAAPGALEPSMVVTLSGLLNAIDGVAARDGRILFITSNHANVLDAALLRPGRVDHRETIGLMAEPEARAMAQLFLAEFSEEWFAAQIVPNLPMAPAALQQILLRGFEAEQRAKAG